MTEELYVTGYCRVLNAARTVYADREEGTADCAYPACPHTAECDVANRLRTFLESETEP